MTPKRMLNPVFLATLAKLVLVFVLSSTGLLSGAHAALFGDAEARKAITDLSAKFEAYQKDAQAQMRALSEQVSQLQKERQEVLDAQKRAWLDVNNQLEAVRSELAQLRGQDEQTVKQMADVQRRMRDLGASLDGRLGKLEPSKISLEGRDFVADPEERKDYEWALAQFRKGDFAAAEQLFTQFQKRYPHSGYLTMVWFWQGNAEYANKDYKDALQSFRQLLATDPGHPKAADALLSIANCHIELKDTRAARKALEDVIAKYPGTEAASLAKERLRRLK